MTQTTSESDQSSIIHQLPPEISNKIAAGEVIQRPASVVKELLDNAIDSGADEIAIVIQNAGRTLIQVSDNGCGMGKSDLRLCFTRHATSKIQDVDDLFKIRTLGFRGEAMASIASVSQIIVTTKRPEDDNGWVYEIWGGEEQKLQPAASDNGTSVAVRNLFYNVPARRQFLKTDATEFRHILKTVQQAALANLDIHFELTADTDTIYQLPPSSLKERVGRIFGKAYPASLIPFKESTSYIDIHGVVSDPKLSKKSRGEQFLFVNGRPFQHRYITYVLLSLYDVWTGPREYPFFAIFINTDPAQLDVNVHPAKTEVKFEDEQSVIRLTKSVVKKALNEHLNIPDMSDSGMFGEDSNKGNKKGFNTDFNINAKRGGGSGRGDFSFRIPSRINKKSGSDGLELSDSLYEQPQNQDLSEGQHSQKGPETPQHGMHPSANNVGGKPQKHRERNFWQLHNRYIVTQTRTGMCLIDQHTAHRRVIFEKTKEAIESALPSTQQLLFAQTVEFSASDFSLLKEKQDLIQRMGFNIQLLSGNTAIISGVPADINVGNEQEVLTSVLHKYREMGNQAQLNEREKMIIAFAMRTAIPRGKKMEYAEMESLLDQLFSCDQPFEGPLGSPTLIYMPLDEIDSRFR